MILSSAHSLLEAGVHPLPWLVH